MPYITQEKREEFRKVGETGHNPETRTAGELNYEITLKLLKHLQVNKLSYQTINDILGALEGAKQEFYHRIARPYEESKIRQNGDVYPI